jgi:indolepyruvate ferredoxin oxidoreductase
VPELATILLAHGVAAVAVSTDDPDRYRKVRLPEGVQVADRRDIVALQERLAAIDGVTVLIHDQECAAELRRARNRGRLAAPRRRVVINHRICEGCGDCGDVSSCLSVQPFDTPLGRKTRIDQESCNFDASCLAGDCPAFMTVEGEAVAGHGPVPPGEHLVIGAPPAPEAPRVRIRFAGIGGTGVVSAAQIVGTAAMLDGWDVDGLDQTGLSQKAGPVVSDLTLTRDGVEGAKLIGEGEADVLVAFDQLVAASPATLRAATDAKTVTIASTTVTPTGTEVVDPNRPRPDPAGPASLLGATSLPGAYVALDAARAASALTGRQATANLLLVGVAVQRGDIPVSPERMRDAIELNGVAVEANLAAFDWGRRYAVHPESVEAEVRARTPAIGAVGTDPLPAPLARRVDGLGLDADAAATVTMLASDLVAYQDRAYAGRFLDLVASAAETERRLARRPGGLCLAVARGYHKLLAYKDEYEVARLMLSADGLAEARALAGGDAKVTWHLHPPTLAGLGMRSKVRFGPASAPLFALLARGKRLRGTPLDPFGRSDVRVLERLLPVEYAEAMTRLLGALGRLDGEPEGLRHQGLAEVTAIAALPEAVRGYEDLKRRRADAYREELARRVEAFTRSEGLAPAPT